MKSAIILAFCAAALTAQKMEVPALLNLAKTPANPAFVPALNETLTAAAIKAGTAVTGYGPDFLFATEAPTAPDLYIDDVRAGSLQAIPGTQTFFTQVKLKTGTSHSLRHLTV